MNEQRRHPDRGIDHLVLAVRDLDAAARTYSALGFTLTPRAEHPWGTANRLVQLDGSFLEVLEVAHPERLVEHGPRSFSFGAYKREWLERQIDTVEYRRAAITGGQITDVELGQDASPASRRNARAGTTAENRARVSCRKRVRPRSPCC